MERRGKGFTLIELLVVIAIIGILAAILFPVLVEAQQRGKMVSCTNNLRQLGMAFQNYANDNNGRMPRVGSGVRPPNWCGAYVRKNADDPSNWCYPDQGQLYKYTKNTSVYLCRSDKGFESDNITSAPKGMKPRDYPLSYSMNYYCDCTLVETLRLLRPSKFMLLIHEERKRINDGIFVPKMPPGQDIPDDVHYTGTTVAYLDGHARWDDNKALCQECDEGYWIPIDKWPPK